MASQYRPNISRQDIDNANIANGNLILSQCDLTRERQRQYRKWEFNVGLIFSYCLGNARHTSLYNQRLHSCNVYISEDREGDLVGTRNSEGLFQAFV